jgi:hypothetical protein
VRNALVERAAGAKGERTLPREKFYIPGSILRMNLDPAAPANAGMAAEVDVFFDENQVFRLLPEAETQGLRRLAWFASDAPLRSGWAWGQQHLKDGVTAFEARLYPGDHLPRAGAGHLPAALQRAGRRGALKTT